MIGFQSLGLLGRCVGRRSVWHANFGKLWIARACIWTPDQLCETKVEHLHRSGTRDHHVSRLDISMCNATTVCRCESVCCLNRNRERLPQIEWLTVDELSHVATFDVLHCDELNVADFVQAEDRADVWVVQRRCELGFAFEASEIGSAVSE